MSKNELLLPRCAVSEADSQRNTTWTTWLAISPKINAHKFKNLNNLISFIFYNDLVLVFWLAIGKCDPLSIGNDRNFRQIMKFDRYSIECKLGEEKKNVQKIKKKTVRDRSRFSEKICSHVILLCTAFPLNTRKMAKNKFESRCRCCDHHHHHDKMTKTFAHFPWNILHLNRKC